MKKAMEFSRSFVLCGVVLISCLVFAASLSDTVSFLSFPPLSQVSFLLFFFFLGRFGGFFGDVLCASCRASFSESFVIVFSATSCD